MDKKNPQTKWITVMVQTLNLPWEELPPAKLDGGAADTELKVSSAEVPASLIQSLTLLALTVLSNEVELETQTTALPLVSKATPPAMVDSVSLSI